MKKFITLLMLANFCTISAQINFEPEKTLIDTKIDSSFDTREIFSSDINGDGFKELFVVSQTTAIWYKNINGDIQHEKAHLLTNSMVNGESIYVADVNNDNLKDILIADSSGHKILIFLNMDNDSFGEPIIINESNNPKSIVAEDINNDGYPDIIAALNNAAVYYLNNGDGTFEEKQELNTYINGFLKVKVLDINNDGLKDIFYLQNDGLLNASLNMGDGYFSDMTIYIGSASSFDFLDADGDGLYDVVTGSPEGISFYKNIDGMSFANLELLAETSSKPIMIVIKDMDNDNTDDIVVLTEDQKIEWYKNYDGIFTLSKVIHSESLNSITRSLIAEDINNDGNIDIIASNFYPYNKISIFTLNSSLDSYEEKIINRNLGGVECVRVADINNDGLNDIVSGYGSIVWNKNIGNNIFSSYYQVSNNPADAVITAYNIELADMNNDGFIDIIATNHGKMVIYKNDGLGNFSLAYNKPLTIYSRDIEVTDINGDSIPDIVLTFTSGSVRLAAITGQGNFEFSEMTPIVFDNPYYEPNKISCGDIDNDGDIDIAVSSSEISAIQLLKNDGDGNFSLVTLAIEITTELITLADIDNNGFLDIIIAASENSGGASGVFLIKNDNGNFSYSYIDEEQQQLSSLAVADINGDGIKDIVGVSYEYANLDEKVICYINIGDTFQKTIIDSLGGVVSLSRDVAVGDLNNDNKPDIVTSHYFVGKVGYYTNLSVLDLDDYKTGTYNDIILYPNPVTNILKWNETESRYSIKIFDLTGKEFFNADYYEKNYIDLSFLKKGIYIVEYTDSDNRFTKKIIKQ